MCELNLKEERQRGEQRNEHARDQLRGAGRVGGGAGGLGGGAGLGGGGACLGHLQKRKSAMVSKEEFLQKKGPYLHIADVIQATAAAGGDARA